ncbi:MAG: STAS domain-containing protein [Chloroflexi bacterium]|nr:STAS domain-containing protein [Chloroflexota bacterium]
MHSLEKLELSRPDDDVTELLPTPVLEVEEGMLLMPVIGPINHRRGTQITDQLLGAVERSRGRVVLVDITGVPRIDRLMVGHLLAAIQSAQLLGALVVLTGVSIEVASTMVSLRVNVDELTCAADLRSGIEIGRQVVWSRRDSVLRSAGRDSGFGIRPADTPFAAGERPDGTALVA